VLVTIGTLLAATRVILGIPGSMGRAIGGRKRPEKGLEDKIKNKRDEVSTVTGCERKAHQLAARRVCLRRSLETAASSQTVKATALPLAAPDLRWPVSF
jgi:hypothetical protein